jgi:hypothetical protein
MRGLTAALLFLALVTGSVRAASPGEVLCAPYQGAWDKVSGGDIKAMESIIRAMPAQCPLRARAQRRLAAVKRQAAGPTKAPSSPAASAAGVSLDVSPTPSSPASVSSVQAVTRYTCVPAPARSVNPIPAAGSIFLTVDETRSCINNSDSYLRRDNGMLKRTTLDDREQRASMFTFSPARDMFTRIDYTLTSDAYASTRGTYPLLVGARCAPVGNQRAILAAQASLKRSDPSFDIRSAAVTAWRRTVWRCATLD